MTPRPACLPADGKVRDSVKVHNSRADLRGCAANGAPAAQEPQPGLAEPLLLGHDGAAEQAAPAVAAA